MNPSSSPSRHGSPSRRGWATLTLALALTVLCCRPAPRHLDVQVGEIVPNFQLPNLDGRDVHFESFRGAPVVLNFWATWCGPCVKEIPTLETLDRRSAAQVVTVALDESGEAAVRPFVEQHGIEYTVLLGNVELLKRFNGRAIPYTLVLDADLRVVDIHRGLVILRTLERALHQAGA